MHLINDSCPLCHHTGKPFFGEVFYLCPNCSGIFRDKRIFLSNEQEKAFYGFHENDVSDPRYQLFVAPITTAILESFTPEHTGLDFGAGTGPVICHVLAEKGYRISPYDPFFHDNPELLRSQYDYVACCEVIEHFHRPDKEFQLLKRLLKPGGSLLCMTHLYQVDQPFDTWYYKNDPTHVFIYQAATFEWIKSEYRFKKMRIHNRLVRLDN